MRDGLETTANNPLRYLEPAESNRIAAHWLATKIEARLGIRFAPTLEMANHKLHSRMTVFQLP